MRVAATWWLTDGGGWSVLGDGIPPRIMRVAQQQSSAWQALRR
jgi:hypothetical protein